MGDNVKSTSKTFTKNDGSSSSGRGNTCSRFCYLVLFESLEESVRNDLKILLDIPEEEPRNDEPLDNELVPSQTFSEHFQSQSLETLMKCKHCDYLS